VQGGHTTEHSQLSWSLCCAETAQFTECVDKDVHPFSFSCTKPYAFRRLYTKLECNAWHMHSCIQLRKLHAIIGPELNISVLCNVRFAKNIAIGLVQDRPWFVSSLHRRHIVTHDWNCSIVREFCHSCQQWCSQGHNSQGQGQSHNPSGQGQGLTTILSTPSPSRSLITPCSFPFWRDSHERNGIAPPLDVHL